METVEIRDAKASFTALLAAAERGPPTMVSRHGEPCAARAVRKGHGRAGRLDRWLDGRLSTYADRILPLDAQAVRLADEISDAAIARGRHPGFADGAIAALAQNASLRLLTCNLKHFETLGVACADPMVELPS